MAPWAAPVDSEPVLTAALALFAGRLQAGYVPGRGCPDAPCGSETMYKRNGLMASVLVTSATPQVRRVGGLGTAGGRAWRGQPQGPGASMYHPSLEHARCGPQRVDSSEEGGRFPEIFLFKERWIPPRAVLVEREGPVSFRGGLPLLLCRSQFGVKSDRRRGRWPRP